MTNDKQLASTDDARRVVHDRQRRWILEGWEKAPGEDWRFKDKVGQFYDWHNGATSLHDTFDPQLRVARSPQEWAAAFEPSFAGMSSALHAVTDEPDVLVSGDIAAANFEFCARLEGADGQVTGAVCRTSHVWGCKDGQWTIIREHTSCRVVPRGEVEALLGKFEPQKLARVSQLEDATTEAPHGVGTAEAPQGHPPHPYVGMWVTGDGRIRQELLANNRYDEARGTRQSAYQGRYAVEGTTILYWDDTGFTADGEFVTENELHHGGMIFFRRR